MTKFYQREINLKPYKRGFHIITSEISTALPELKDITIGELSIFIKHTSASLTINENADPTVLIDFETHFNKLVPEKDNQFLHTIEGSDDMPAHIKSSLLQTNLKIPITNGKLNLGTWQGIYLCEHRNRGGARKLVLTLIGV